MEPAARHLVFHGAVVLFIGLLCGAPYGRAVNRGAPPHIVQSWRLAHASLPIGAILMFTAAMLLGSFAVPDLIRELIAIMLIASGYSFCVSVPLAAMVGQRGLSYRGPLTAKVVFAGNVLGSATSMAASLILIYAAFMSL